MSLITKNARFNEKHINTASAPLSLSFKEKRNCQKSWNIFLDMNWYNYSKSKNIKIKRSNWFHRITTRKIRGNSIASICTLIASCKLSERVLHINLIGMVSSKKWSYSYLSKRNLMFTCWMHCMYIFIMLIFFCYKMNVMFSVMLLKNCICEVIIQLSLFHNNR